jgi:hypothetical protein
LDERILLGLALQIGDAFVGDDEQSGVHGWIPSVEISD